MINGLMIANYRSFGEDAQILAPTSQVNLIIGKNNCGKSNILRTLASILPRITGGEDGSAVRWDNDLDSSRFSKAESEPLVGLLVKVDSLEADFNIRNSDTNFKPILENLRHSLTSRGIPGVWFWKKKRSNIWGLELKDDLLEITEEAFRNFGGIGRIAGTYFGRSSSSPSENLKFIFGGLNPFGTQQRVALIPAARSTQFQPQSGRHQLSSDLLLIDGQVDLGGVGLIDRLFKLQIPNIVERQSAQRFRNLTEFVRSVTNEPTANIQVPHDKSAIYVSINDQILPLSNYGSGIEQVVIVAAAATILEEHIICLEEPETNLHPEFQIRLLNYLKQNSKNQYFITTHSHSIIDLDRTNVFSIRLDINGSKIAQLLDTSNKHEVVFDLGYRPSDLAQCNCIIWIEGPSDRIYLKAALMQKAPDLVEGIDFTLMFYGGRLLSHLSADDEQIDQFIVLTQINRRSAIVIDSDKASEEREINQTKQRVSREFSERGLFVWITEGREIENYVDSNLMSDARRVLAPSATFSGHDKFDDLCTGVSNQKHIALDKIKLARQIIEFPSVSYRYDWSEKLDGLISHVRRSR